MRVKLLTANLCMISPTGCVKRSVPLGIMGGVLAIGLLETIPSVYAAVQRPGPIAGICLMYCLMGLHCSRGVLWALAFGVISAVEHLVFELFWVQRVLALIGFVFLALGPSSYLATCCIRVIKPSYLFDAQEERLKVFLNLVQKYDILCLQEVTIFWGLDAVLKTILNEAARHGIAHSVSSGRWPALPATFATTGLCILSRYPILKSQRLNFSSQSWFEWSAIQRGVLMAELDVEGRRVAVLNVHTTSGLAVLEAGVGQTSAESRENMLGWSQLYEALENFETFSEGADEKVVCGDFNLDKISFAFGDVKRRMHQLGLKDCYPDCPATFGCSDEPVEKVLTQTADRGSCKCLDHIFSSSVPAAVRIEAMAAPKELWDTFQQVSDHRGVEAVWDWD